MSDPSALAVPIELGPYTQGEIPDQFTYQYLQGDADSTPVDLTDFTDAGLVYWVFGGEPVEREAAIGPVVANGEVTYAWVEADMAAFGDFQGRVWVSKDGKRLSSPLIVWTVDPAILVPDI